VWSRNIKNGCSIYIYDISRLRVNRPYKFMYKNPVFISYFELKFLSENYSPLAPSSKLTFIPNKSSLNFPNPSVPVSSNPDLEATQIPGSKRNVP
jgi:hypothetical protein